MAFPIAPCCTDNSTKKLALLETLMPTSSNCDHSLLDSVQHRKKLPLLDLSIEHAALLLSALFANSSLINSKGTDHPCKVNKLKAFAGKTTGMFVSKEI
jgi:hypothetical protein